MTNGFLGGRSKVGPGWPVSRRDRTPGAMETSAGQEQSRIEGGPMTLPLRWVCVAAVLALASAASADEHGGTEQFHPLSALTAAVLDWCEAQGREFLLPDIGSPSCNMGEGVFFTGTVRGIFGAAMAPDAAWWWKFRTAPTGMVVGVLWYVGPNNPRELCAASRGALCQCSTAHAALNNPARVPVVVIGPGAAVCEAG